MRLYILLVACILFNSIVRVVALPPQKRFRTQPSQPPQNSQPVSLCGRCYYDAQCYSLWCYKRMCIQDTSNIAICRQFRKRIRHQRRRNRGRLWNGGDNRKKARKKCESCVWHMECRRRFHCIARRCARHVWQRWKCTLDSGGKGDHSGSGGVGHGGGQGHGDGVGDDGSDDGLGSLLCDDCEGAKRNCKKGRKCLHGKCVEGVKQLARCGVFNVVDGSKVGGESKDEEQDDDPNGNKEDPSNSPVMTSPPTAGAGGGGDGGDGGDSGESTLGRGSKCEQCHEWYDCGTRRCVLGVCALSVMEARDVCGVRVVIAPKQPRTPKQKKQRPQKQRRRKQRRHKHRH